MENQLRQASNFGVRNMTYLGEFGDEKNKRIPFLKNKAEKLLITQARVRKTKPNKPKNKAENLLKTCSCGKNKPETNRKTKRAMLLKTESRQKSTENLSTPLSSPRFRMGAFSQTLLVRSSGGSNASPPSSPEFDL
jgi:hypothetical protein